MNPPIVLDTPEQIAGFQLLTIRMGIRAEMRGMRLTRGVNCCKAAREKLIAAGLTAPKDKAQLYAAFESYLVQLGVLRPPGGPARVP